MPAADLFLDRQDLRCCCLRIPVDDSGIDCKLDCSVGKGKQSSAAVDSCSGIQSSGNLGSWDEPAYFLPEDCYTDLICLCLETDLDLVGRWECLCFLLALSSSKP